MIKIDKNIPIPAKTYGYAKGRRKASTVAMLETFKLMCVGDSFVVKEKGKVNTLSGIIKTLKKDKEVSEDVTITSRAQKDGSIRIWKILKTCEE